MTTDEYRSFPPSNPSHPDHQMPWHTEACFQASRVIECDGKRDTRRCNVCGKEWQEACNFDEECS
jgi:hypothetical protein